MSTIIFHIFSFLLFALFMRALICANCAISKNKASLRARSASPDAKKNSQISPEVLVVAEAGLEPAASGL